MKIELEITIPNDNTIHSVSVYRNENNEMVCDAKNVPIEVINKASTLYKEMEQTKFN